MPGAVSLARSATGGLEVSFSYLVDAHVVVSDWLLELASTEVAGKSSSHEAAVIGEKASTRAAALAPAPYDELPKQPAWHRDDMAATANNANANACTGAGTGATAAAALCRQRLEQQAAATLLQAAVRGGRSRRELRARAGLPAAAALTALSEQLHRHHSPKRPPHAEPPLTAETEQQQLAAFLARRRADEGGSVHATTGEPERKLRTRAKTMSYLRQRLSSSRLIKEGHTPQQPTAAVGEARTSRGGPRRASSQFYSRHFSKKRHFSKAVVVAGCQGGLGLGLDDSNRVTEITPGGPAEACRLFRLGDRLISADGVSLAGRRLQDVLKPLDRHVFGVETASSADDGTVQESISGAARARGSAPAPAAQSSASGRRRFTF